jgi:hypothetical protein
VAARDMLSVGTHTHGERPATKEPCIGKKECTGFKLIAIVLLTGIQRLLQFERPVDSLSVCVVTSEAYVWNECVHNKPRYWGCWLLAYWMRFNVSVLLGPGSPPTGAATTFTSSVTVLVRLCRVTRSATANWINPCPLMTTASVTVADVPERNSCQ